MTEKQLIKFGVHKVNGKRDNSYFYAVLSKYFDINIKLTDLTPSDLLYKLYELGFKNGVSDGEYRKINEIKNALKIK